MMRKPETHNAMLASAGHARLRVTRHVYAETRRVDDCYEYIYRCLETGALRLWGCEPIDHV